MPTSTFNHLREEILASAGRRPYPASGTVHDRGIAVCAGGPVMLVNAYVLVRLLRHTLGCALPIEIWHMGPLEMPSLMARQFELLGCQVRDAHACATGGDDYQPRDGWQLKSYALIHSSFGQVLMLDADQVPVTDPTAIFEWTELHDSGAVFWPDVVELSDQNPVWQKVGLEPMVMRSMESGQICIDRKRHWRALCAADEINRRAETFYQMIYGDKDTFLLAWLMTGSAYAMVPHLPHQSEKCLYQRDFSGDPVFQHRTNCKFRLTGPRRFPAGSRHQEDCERYLTELARFWDGRIYHPPARSLEARRLEEEIVSRRSFCLLPPDGGEQHITLLDGHQIGAGRSHELVNWHVADGAAGPELVLMDFRKPSMVLQPAGQGRWAGSRLIDPAGPVVLTASGLHEAPEAGSSRWVRSLVTAASGDAASLRAALELIGRAEPALAVELSMLADELAISDPALAAMLAEIAAGLEPPVVQGGGRLYGRAPLEPPFYRRG